MGLAGPRVRQRISADPQNRAWAEDTSKFGFRMLEKMGWSSGKGLGADESGTTSHVKVSLKSDASGIGAKAKNSDNWLSNTDAFSRLLADLNARVEEEGEGAKEEDAASDASSSDASRKNKAKKEKEAAKKEKKGKKEKKEKKKSKKAATSSDSDNDDDENDVSSSRAATPPPSSDSPDAVAVAALTHARYAARARYLRNKRLATSSAESVDAILALKKAERVREEKEKRKQTPTPTVDDVLAPQNDDDEVDDDRPVLGLGANGAPAAPSFISTYSDMSSLMAMFVQGSTIGPSTTEEVKENDVQVPTPTPSEDAESAGEGKKKKSKSKDKKSKKEKKQGKKRSRDADDAEADGEGVSKKKKRKSRD